MLTEEQRAWYILQGYEIKETLGVRRWYLNGKCHREDGPAVEYSNGTQHIWYLLNGIEMTEEEHKIAVAKLRNKNAIT